MLGGGTQLATQPALAVDVGSQRPGTQRHQALAPGADRTPGVVAEAAADDANCIGGDGGRGGVLLAVAVSSTDADAGAAATADATLAPAEATGGRQVRCHQTFL